MPVVGVIDNEIQPEPPLQTLENFFVPSPEGTSCTWAADGEDDILSVKEINVRGGGGDSGRTRRFTRSYRVIAKHAKVPVLNVIKANGLPKYGEGFIINVDGEPIVADTSVAVVEKSATMQQEDNYNVWIVTVFYDSLGSPTMLPWDVSWDYATEQVAAVREIDDPPDYVGSIIANSAGDPFDPPIPKDRNRSVLTISRYTNTFSSRKPRLWKDKVNLLPVTIDFEEHEIGTLKVKSVNAVREVVNLTAYWKETVIVECDPDGWTHKILDRGFRVLSPSGQPIIYKDEFGRAPSQPIPLDGNGHKLPTGDPPVYLEFLVYERKDFDLLRLDYREFGMGIDPNE